MSAPTLAPARALGADRIARELGRPEPTAEQRAVIEAPLEPLLVVAGAGSGKTETMAARVVWLVANGLVAPDQVLGLTFTRKAAGELADRVRSRLRGLRRAGLLPSPSGTTGTGGAADPPMAPGTGEPVVSTYHSFAASVVADHGLRVGVEPRSRLLGEAAAWQLASRVVESWDGDLGGLSKAPRTVVEAVIALSAECAEHLVEPEEVADLLGDVLDRVRSLPRSPRDAGTTVLSGLGGVVEALDERRAVVPLLRAYAEAKRQADALDFGDQMALAARIARRFSAVGDGERAKAAVVLLDEYQDTSHAQLVLLRELFGGGHAVTAVGDPHQSIYGWRGASAGTLDAFAREFRDRRGAPATVLGLATSWRNDRAVLAAANRLAEPLRAASRVPVPALVARPGVGAGAVELAWAPTAAEEAAGVAARLAQVWAEDAETSPAGSSPTGPVAARRRSMAVLCRKRSQLPVVEEALRSAGLPVEVVGLGGLLTRPEVVDVVSVLRVLDDPCRGDGLVRLLTGPRWRVGPRDLETLAVWARTLAARQRAVAGNGSGDAEDGAAGPSGRRPADGDAAAAETSDAAGPMPDAAEAVSLVDALDHLPPRGWTGRHGHGLSAEGRDRLQQLAGVLRRLRAEAGSPLPELVGAVERALGLDVELAARPGTTPGAARAQLDAFTDVAAAFDDAAGSHAPLAAFCAWLTAAAERERGLDTAEESDDVALAQDDVEPSRTAVQVLTVHAAKGLEWDVVAVPGMVEGTFPVRSRGRVGGPDVDSGWLSGLGTLPYPLRGDAPALPVLDWRGPADQKELAERRERFRLDCGAHRVAEERRLAYVAATRARELLLLSGSSWRDGKTTCTPSRFLAELADAADGGLLPGVDATAYRLGLAAAPDQAEGNPSLRSPASAAWPSDPLGPRRPAVEAAAAEVRDASRRRAAGAPGDLGEWADEVDLLLAERATARDPASPTVVLPVHLAASRLVDLAADPAAFAVTLRRPVPVAPRPQSRRGTAFHAWLEARYRADALVDVDDLPGASDDGAPPDEELQRLQEAFLASEWALRDPVAVEVPVETPVDGTVLRGRIDAVFRSADGGWDVVDWKTGTPPTGARRRAAAVQLAVYRLAWSRLRGVPLAEVSAAFVHVATGETLRPADPLDEAGLVALLRRVPRA